MIKILVLWKLFEYVMDVEVDEHVDEGRVD
jgi:hypothetical protein